MKLKQALLASAFFLLNISSAVVWAANGTTASAPAALAHTSAQTQASAAPAEAQAPVNINTADVKALSTLKGIGPAKAQAIVDYRKANGKFAAADDLAKVKGIGAKIVADNLSRIVTQ